LKKTIEDQVETSVFEGGEENTEGYEVVDIGPKTVEGISGINQGHLFVLG
jgi:hypothetical protein